MSHKKITINNSNPNSEGSLALGIDSFITESNPAVGQMLEYDGNSFINNTVSTASSLDLKLAYHYETTSFGSGTYSFSVGDYVVYRDNGAITYSETGFTFNDATSTNSAVSNTKWFESVSIPEAGTYLFIRTIPIRTTGTYTMRNYNNAGGFGMYTKIELGKNNSGGLIWGIADCTVNDVFRTVITSKSGTLYIPRHRETRFASLLIFKL